MKIFLGIFLLIGCVLGDVSELQDDGYHYKKPDNPLTPPIPNGKEYLPPPGVPMPPIVNMMLSTTTQPTDSRPTTSSVIPPLLRTRPTEANEYLPPVPVETGGDKLDDDNAVGKPDDLDVRRGNEEPEETPEEESPAPEDDNPAEEAAPEEEKPAEEDKQVPEEAPEEEKPVEEDKPAEEEAPEEEKPAEEDKPVPEEEKPAEEAAPEEDKPAEEEPTQDEDKPSPEDDNKPAEETPTDVENRLNGDVNKEYLPPSENEIKPGGESQPDDANPPPKNNGEPEPAHSLGPDGYSYKVPSKRFRF